MRKKTQAEPISIQNRHKFMMLCMKKGLSDEQIVSMTALMSGKTNSEKESIAAQLIEQLSTKS